MSNESNQTKSASTDTVLVDTADLVKALALAGVDLRRVRGENDPSGFVYLFEQTVFTLEAISVVDPSCGCDMERYSPRNAPRIAGDRSGLMAAAQAELLSGLMLANEQLQKSLRTAAATIRPLLPHRHEEPPPGGPQ